MLELENGVLICNADHDVQSYGITIEDVSNRLLHLGYTVTSDDVDHLIFELTKTINYTLNYCNIKTIPSILNPRIIDKICYEFLFYKKNTGTLSNFDYEVAIKQIKEGDTTVSYAVGQGEDTPENRFDAMVKQLERGFDKWLTPHRRIRW